MGSGNWAVSGDTDKTEKAVVEGLSMEELVERVILFELTTKCKLPAPFQAAASSWSESCSLKIVNLIKLICRSPGEKEEEINHHETAKRPSRTASLFLLSPYYHLL